MSTEVSAEQKAQYREQTLTIAKRIWEEQVKTPYVADTLEPLIALLVKNLGNALTVRDLLFTTLTDVQTELASVKECLPAKHWEKLRSVEKLIEPLKALQE